MNAFHDRTYLFVSSRSAETLGRVERRWLRVMAALVERGATVFLICTPKAVLAAPARGLGVTIAPYRLDKFNLVRTRSRMRKYLKRYRPVVAHSTGYEADVLLRWAAKNLPVKVASSAICGSWPPRGVGAFDSWVRRLLDHGSLSRVDAFFADCDDLAERLTAAGLPRERIVLDPPAVLLSRIARAAPRGPSTRPPDGLLSGTRGPSSVAAASSCLPRQRPRSRPCTPTSASSSPAKDPPGRGSCLPQPMAGSTCSDTWQASPRCLPRSTSACSRPMRTGRPRRFWKRRRSGSRSSPRRFTGFRTCSTTARDRARTAR